MVSSSKYVFCHGLIASGDNIKRVKRDRNGMRRETFQTISIWQSAS
jgi:hypothetical protein